MSTVKQASVRLERGEASAQALAREALDRIADPDGQGRRTFLSVHENAALAAAQRVDHEQRRCGRRRGPLAGIPVSVKDLFDEAAEPTPAGSRVLAQSPTAKRDSDVVQRLRAAGAVIVGRTNMTEFAYSGLGINPHYGTPLNPYQRERGRIPGGSSSGAAVSVSDGMALAAVATDTGGSARIPAAFCGLTGFKPTAARISLRGTFPLSPSLDSVGAIGATVECCANLDAVMAGTDWQSPPEAEGAPLRLGMVMDYVDAGMDAQVAHAYERALATLSRRGVRIQPVRFPELLELPGFNAKGGFTAYESYRHHASLIAARAAEYDPRVASRILRGQAMDDADYRQLQAQRMDFIARASRRFEGFDALVAPTVPIVAPLLDECEDEAEYARLNLLALRNPTVVNFLDGCAISLPCHERGDAPVGLMLFQTANRDRALLSLASEVERRLQFHAPTP
jgi:aspartyl-tRNA(Asn)/glutamyl-tRNA(Gln) amidotransferase subunit A